MVLIAAITIAAIVFGVLIGVSYNKSLTLSPKALESCKTLSFSGDKALNILIFGDKAVAERYSSFLLGITPFVQNKNALNFYYIDSYKPSCELYKGVALYCYSKELIKKSASCPSDYVVVIQDRDSRIRSSSYMNVLSINEKHKLMVFPHEFGHAFGQFSEEYTPANLMRGSKNCVSSCSEFGEFEDKCFEGCSKGEYYRYADSGIMRTLDAQNYGLYDEQLLTEKLQKQKQTITGKAVDEMTSCSEQEYYLIEGNYSNGISEIVYKTIEKGCVGSNGAGQFRYSIMLNDGREVSEGEFNSELIFTDAPIENGNIDGEVITYAGAFFLKVPFVENAKELRISDYEKTISVRLNDRGARPCEI